MKRFIITFLSTVATLLLSAQINTPVKWSFDSKAGGKTLVVNFTATIDEGWHIYDQNLPADGPRSTTFVFEELKGAKLSGKTTNVQQPIEMMEEMFGMSLRYYEGNVTFQQSLQLENSDDYTIKGYVEYMACNNEACLPPSKEEFVFERHEAPKQVESVPVIENKGNRENNGGSKTVKPTEKAGSPFSFPAITEDTASNDPFQIAEEADTWKPVIAELNALGQKAETENPIWSIFCLGLLGGLIAILTPCVWPVIPMTVSFFLHKKDGSGKRSALLYGLSIILIYVGLGLLITLLFGADALNSLSTNAVFNIFLFLLLLCFAISFFGGFNIALPASWSTATETKADQTTGILSILLMAATLVIVSFSCTGPIIGTLLVHISTKGSLLAPTLGMLGFAIALAGPFTLFALFPNILKKMPKSGSWMNTVKVLLGFFELAFSLKFLSVADLAYGWHILDREVFIVLWIAIAILLALYLLGKIQFKDDSPLEHLSVTRFFGALASIAFAAYLLPGLWGAPLKAISAFTPPIKTQDFTLYEKKEAHFNDYDEAIDFAQKNNKPLLIDFSGYGCVNCRKMETSVWSDPRVNEVMYKKYVLVSLFVDDRTPLEEPMIVEENGKQQTLTTKGEKWSYLQRHKFGANAQPFYVEIDANGKPLNGSFAFTEDANLFYQFLLKGLEKK